MSVALMRCARCGELVKTCDETGCIKCGRIRMCAPIQAVKNKRECICEPVFEIEDNFEPEPRPLQYDASLSRIEIRAELERAMRVHTGFIRRAMRFLRRIG